MKIPSSGRNHPKQRCIDCDDFGDKPIQIQIILALDWKRRITLWFQTHFAKT